MTVMSEEARRERVKAAIDALSGLHGQYERITLPWAGQSPILDVVNVPLDAVVLNPRSHRIRAEIESHKHRSVIEEAPYDEEAQELLAGLLRSTRGFEELKRDLKENGQLDFGVITVTGLLVNANTRAVALRELGKTHIKAAVLPADADERAIVELEAYLQLRVERKQPYSFPNELLFIKDMKEAGKTDDELALQLGYAPSNTAGDLKRGREKVQQAIRMLAIMREVCALSDGAITLQFFENNARVPLQEIDQAYEATRGKDQAKAQRVRSGKLLGLLLGVGYEKVRKIDERLLTSYLRDGLSESEGLSVLDDDGNIAGESAANDDVLALFEPPDVDGGVLDVSPVLAALARTHGSSEVRLPGDTSPRPREAAVNSVRTAVENAISEYENDATASDRLNAPKALTEEAVRKLNKAKAIVQQVKSSDGFKASDVLLQVQAVKRSVEALERELGGEAGPSAHG